MAAHELFTERTGHSPEPDQCPPAALPAGWSVEPRLEPANSPNPGKRLDGAIDIRSSSSVIGTFAVEVQRSFGPRDIDRLLAGFARVLRSLSYNIPILVIAPWL